MKKLPRDIIFLHMCTINNNHMMYGPWDMEHDRQNFLSLWTAFCLLHPCPPPNTQKIKILKKMKKTPEDIIILQMCTVNDSHMIYGSWDMERNGHNFLSFWTVFCSFTYLTTQKIKILEKWKKSLEILSFCIGVP